MNYLKDPGPKDAICMPPWDIPSRSKLNSTDEIPSKYLITGIWKNGNIWKFFKNQQLKSR